MILKVKVNPTEGQIKIIKQFAFFPTWINDNLIWLQTYKKHYKYTYKSRPTLYTGFMLPPGLGWDFIKYEL